MSKEISIDDLIKTLKEVEDIIANFIGTSVKNLEKSKMMNKNLLPTLSDKLIHCQLSVLF